MANLPFGYMSHAQLTTDRNVSVRSKTVAMLGDWLTSLPDRCVQYSREYAVSRNMT